MAAQAEYLKQLLGDVGSNVQTLFEDESLLLFDDQGDFGSATLSAMINEFKSEAKITDETNEHHIAVTIALAMDTLTSIVSNDKNVYSYRNMKDEHLLPPTIQLVLKFLADPKLCPGAAKFNAKLAAHQRANAAGRSQSRMRV